MKIKKNQKVGKVLFVISIIALVMGVIYIAIQFIRVTTGMSAGAPFSLEGILIIIVAIILGGFAHAFIDKNGEKWERVAYVLTFPAYILAFVIIVIVGTMITYFLAMRDKKPDNKVIEYNGNEAELEFICDSVYYVKSDNKYKDFDSSPMDGAHYSRYRGNGYYWMSFDDGKTFVKEDEFNPFTYKKN